MLICAALLGEYEPTAEEVADFMAGGDNLSPEDKSMLEKVSKELPEKIEEWKAERDGCMIVKDERSEMTNLNETTIFLGMPEPVDSKAPMRFQVLKGRPPKPGQSLVMDCKGGFSFDRIWNEQPKTRDV